MKAQPLQTGSKRSSETQQPNWHLIGYIGDVNPFDGTETAFVLIDTTGVYDPEMAVIRGICSADEVTNFEVSRLVLEPCFYSTKAGVKSLSDNHYHSDKPVWFADRLEGVAAMFGITSQDVVHLLVSSSIMRRAEGYLMLVNYFGVHEFDSAPVVMTRGQIKRRYRSFWNRKNLR